ncbi:transposase domain-containing protein [Phyllobacterium leguminum]|uniref:Mu transposase-like protein n=1 Tax=Phyllobacterium leguminum TaxID=314237 RepID=A0A318SZZ0_9HYPH|nr:transposase domain-containing protein [Phyllobacterium leguminum]PYE86883.1 Mu transposase-like protein [Phyllobacterium leguminum]
MADGWYSVEEAVQVADPAMPASVRGWNRKITEQKWRAADGKARKAGHGWEYHLTLFPQTTQNLLPAKEADAAAKPSSDTTENPIWRRYDELPQKHKDECARRLTIVKAAHRLMSVGKTQTAAIEIAAREAGISTPTLRNWLNTVRGVRASDWLAALAPDYKATAQFTECHPKAWEALKSDYLRAEAPKFSACYRRLEAAAKREGWEPLPSERALRRRFEAEVPQSVIKLKRSGRDELKKLYPAQRRTKKRLRAMQVVNIDGHRWDIWVHRPSGNGEPFRPLLVAIQDIFSGKFLAWRHCETENRVAVRLVIGDVVERYGIFDEIVLDNGRGFASKWITGGTPNRYRFKVRDDEPDGLLTQLGVEVHWATPYAGQSKPIERAFRDFCEDIAKHPFCAGAYTGNSPVNKPENYGSRVLEWDEFRQFVDGMIAEHNARVGRKTETAKGRSFDEAFAASIAEPSTIVRWPTTTQRDLWLLMAEEVTARKGNGEIHLLGNRYWTEELIEHAGKKLAARFDPDDLTRPIKVYDLRGSLLCEAPSLGDVDFIDAEEAHTHNRLRAAFQKKQRELAELHVTMKPDELGRLYAPTAVSEKKSMKPAVTRLATRGNAALKPRPEESWNEEAEAAFENVASLMGRRLLKEA